MSNNEYFPTIGLEIHAELHTKSKMWCGCVNDPFVGKPNVNICEVCMAHPGTLPVANKEAIKKTIKTGFYDVLNNAPLQLLAKRTKAIEQEKSGITIKNLFVPYTKYFLSKESTYYEISGKKDMLKVLKDRKQELEQYIKANNLSFKNEDMEPSMIKLANYYNQLTR